MSQPSHETIAARIFELGALLPTLLERYPDDADFFPVWAQHADAIMHLAGEVSDDTHDYAFQALEAILIQAGKVDPAERTT